MKINPSFFLVFVYCSTIKKILAHKGVYAQFPGTCDYVMLPGRNEGGNLINSRGLEIGRLFWTI